MHFFAYWGRAFAYTWNSIWGNTFQKIALSLIPFVVAFALYRITFGWDDSIRDQLVWALYFLIAEAVVFIMAAIFVAPPGLSKDAAADFLKRENGWRQQQEQLGKDMQELRGVIEQLRTQADAKPAAVADILDILVELAREGQRLVRANKGKTECEAWYERARAITKEVLRTRYAEEIEARWQTRHNSDPDLQARQATSACCAGLQDWEKAPLSDKHINPAFTARKLAEYRAANT